MDLKLSTGMKVFLHKALPINFFNEVNTSRCKLSNISTMGQFARWCSRECDVNIVITYVLYAETIDIDTRCNICIWLLLSKRLSPIERDLIKDLKSLLLEKRRYSNKEYRKRSAIAMSDIDEYHLNTKRIKYDIRSSVVRHFNTYIHIDILQLIFEYLDIISQHTARQVSFGYRQAYFNIPTISYIPYCNIYIFIRNTRRKILHDINSQYSSDNALNTFKNLESLKIKREQGLIPDSDHYLSEVYNICRGFVSTCGNKKRLLFWTPCADTSIAPHILDLNTVDMHISTNTYYVNTRYLSPRHNIMGVNNYINKLITDRGIGITSALGQLEKTIYLSSLSYHDQLIQMCHMKPVFVMLNKDSLPLCNRVNLKGDLKNGVSSVRYVVIMDHNMNIRSGKSILQTLRSVFNSVPLIMRCFPNTKYFILVSKISPTPVNKPHIKRLGMFNATNSAFIAQEEIYIQ